WIVTLPANVADRTTIRLSGSVPLPAMAEMVLPDVRVEEARAQERYVAVAGDLLRESGSRGLKPLTDLTKALGRWPATVDRIRQTAGSAWSIVADGWSSPLRTRASPANSPKVEILLLDQAAAILDGQRWAHRAICWLYHEAGSELRFRLPSGAKLTSITVDGRLVPAL